MADELVEITKDEDGTQHGTTGQAVVSIMPDVECRVFRRNFIRGVMSPSARKIVVMVAELPCGTRIYAYGNSVIVTKTDMYL
jgi:hypothetical protein